MEGYHEKSICLPVLGRVLILLVGAGAIAASIVSVGSCQFFTYRALDGEPWQELTPPFDVLSAASVGLFAFSDRTSAETNPLVGDACQAYDDWKEVGQTVYWNVAQWTSLFAPIASTLAVLQILFEVSGLCRIRGSYGCITFFFFVAFALQACSFMIFLDTQYCFDAASQNQCALKTGGFAALAATTMYLVLAIITASNNTYNLEERPCFGGCCFCLGLGTSAMDTSFPTKNKESETNKDIEEGKAREEPNSNDQEDVVGVKSGEEEIGQSPRRPDPLMDEENALFQSDSVEVNPESVKSKSTADSETQPPNNSLAGTIDPPASEGEEEPVTEAKETENTDAKETMGTASKDLEASSDIVDETAQEIVVNDTMISRKADVLDICCGDPLDLSRAMDEKQAESQKRRNWLGR